MVVRPQPSSTSSSVKLAELKELAESQNFLCLVLPRKSLPRGANVRLAGRQGPYGSICNVKEAYGGYDVVAVFDSQDILAFIARKGL